MVALPVTPHIYVPQCPQRNRGSDLQNSLDEDKTPSRGSEHLSLST